MPRRVYSPHRYGRKSTNLPSEAKETQAQARILKSDALAERPDSAPPPPNQGARAACGIIIVALAKHHRLPAGAFRRVFQQGRTVKDSFFFFKALPTQLSVLRVGISTPIKSVSRAIDRTRIRRSISGTIEPIVKRTALGYDIVVVIKRSPLGDPAAMDSLRAAFQKIVVSLKTL